MPVKTPHWFPWLSPLCAALGAWLLGVQVLQGGFWIILCVALGCAFVPFVVFRLACRLRYKSGSEARNG